MKKIVLKLELHDDRKKTKAMQKVSGLSGVESISIDKDKKLTVTGDVDPVNMAGKLRKLCHTDIVSVGPAKEPEKKKEEPAPKKENKTDDVAELVKAYKAYNSQMTTCYCVRSIEEYPSGCIIS